MKCEKCLAETTDGAEYRFYYGHLKDTSTTTGTVKDSAGIYRKATITTNTYKMVGSQDVFLCNQCVLRSANVLTIRWAALYLILALGAAVVIIFLANILGWGSPVADLIIVAFMLLWMSVGISWPMVSRVRRITKALQQHDQEFLRGVMTSGRIHHFSVMSLSDEGDAIAIQLRSPELRENGNFDAFLSRGRYSGLI